MKLISIALLLFSTSALAFEGEVVENAFTGCVSPNGTVRDLQRGDEPRRECRPRAEEARFAEVPPGFAVESWDVSLEFNEQFSPAIGIQMICSTEGGLAFLEISIRGTVVLELSGSDRGIFGDFVFHGNFSRDELHPSVPFLVRAAGAASAFAEQGCFSTGFAETFDPFDESSNTLAEDLNLQ
jgi:hypothetical protein